MSGLPALLRMAAFHSTTGERLWAWERAAVRPVQRSGNSHQGQAKWFERTWKALNLCRSLTIPTCFACAVLLCQAGISTVRISKKGFSLAFPVGANSSSNQSTETTLCWGCSAWRREGSGVTLEQPSGPWRGPTGRMERDFSQGHGVIGQGGTALNQKRADLD